MFKILLAEDEPPILRSVKKAIESADSEFSVSRCCNNGGEAKAALEEESFDIVVTDIKMPVMTGIELAGWIYENKPETMVILLSGYSDFEYARKALQYKVFDYILKPVSKQKITELTRRIRAELKSEPPKPTIKNDENSTVVMLVCAGTYLLRGADIMMPGENFWTDEETDDIMKKILKPGEEHIFFNTNIRSERIVIISAESTERQDEIAAQFAAAIHSETAITIVYKTGVKFKDAGKTVPELRELMTKHLVLGHSQLISCKKNTESYENISTPYSRADIDAITDAIRRGNSYAMRENLTRLLFCMRDNLCTQEDVISLFNVIIDTYTLNYPDKLKRKNSSVKHEITTAVAGFTTYEALTEDTASILMTMRSDVAADRYDRLADKIEEYIIENFNTSITSETLAKEFGFVPSYISRIFKKKKGISPSEFLIQYRIKTAKRAFRENPDIMIKEVAEMTGFKESYYFSKTFKRETGMWPTEYAGREAVGKAAHTDAE